MKIGIIIHSHTGNTLQMAQRLSEALATHGHEPRVLRVTAVDEKSPAKAMQLKDVPDTSEYDVLIFGAPVWAFSLSPVMRLYLEQLPSLEGKKVGVFLTQLLPCRWMGGNRALRQMVAAFKAKDCRIYGTGIVNWSSKKREQQIKQIIEKFISFRS